MLQTIKIIERESFQLTVGESQSFASMFQNIDSPKVFQGFREPCEIKSRASADAMGTCVTETGTLNSPRVSSMGREPS